MAESHLFSAKRKRTDSFKWWMKNENHLKSLQETPTPILYIYLYYIIVCIKNILEKPIQNDHRIKPVREMSKKNHKSESVIF